MERTAQAEWNGSLKDGKGTLSSGSGVLRATPYSFHTRFENSPGTNPEELIAAAHAGCFSMAFSGELGKVGVTPQSIETKAKLKFEKLDAGWTVTRIDLNVTVRTAGAEEGVVRKAADAAKIGCPISRLLKAEIGLHLTVAA